MKVWLLNFEYDGEHMGTGVYATDLDVLNSIHNDAHELGKDAIFIKIERDYICAKVGNYVYTAVKVNVKGKGLS